MKRNCTLWAWGILLLIAIEGQLDVQALPHIFRDGHPVGDEDIRYPLTQRLHSVGVGIDREEGDILPSGIFGVIIVSRGSAEGEAGQVRLAAGLRNCVPSFGTGQRAEQCNQTG